MAEGRAEERAYGMLASAQGLAGGVGRAKDAPCEVTAPAVRLGGLRLHLDLLWTNCGWSRAPNALGPPIPWR